MSNDRHINSSCCATHHGRWQRGRLVRVVAQRIRRSLEELADSPIVEEFVRREFPQPRTNGMTR